MKLQGHSGLGDVAVSVAVSVAMCTVEMFQTAVGDFCAHKSSYRRFWNGKNQKLQSAVLVARRVWYTKLSDRSWNLVTSTTDRPIQVTLTNYCYLFSPAGQSEVCMYRYRHVETDLCLIMFPALPLLLLLLYPLLFLHHHQLQSDFHFPPPHNHSCFLRICWADATSPNVTNWTRTFNKI